MFCVKFNRKYHVALDSRFVDTLKSLIFKLNQTDALENYVNLPLSLMVNEVILTVLFILAGVSVLVSLCPGPAKIGGIFTGVSIIVLEKTKRDHRSKQLTCGGP